MTTLPPLPARSRPLLRASRAIDAALIAAAVLLAALGAWGSARWDERLGLQQLAATMSERLELYAAALEAEIGRYAALPSLIAVDGHIAALIASPGDPRAQRLASQTLARMNARAGSMAMAIIAPDGTVIAGSGARVCDAASVALLQPAGELTDHFAARPADGSTEYHFVHDIPGSDARIVVVVSLSPLEATWIDLGMRTRSERLLVIDEHGVVVMSSVPAWKYRTVDDAPSDGLRPTERYPQAALRPLELVVDARLDNLGAQLVHPLEPGGTPDPRRLAQERAIVPLAVRLVSLSDLSDVRRSARAAGWGGAAAGAAAGLFAMILLHRRRASLALRRAHGRLETLVTERTQALQSANEELTRRIAEREQMEAELTRANRLAVLGQMSAFISHEINQPLTALRALPRNTMRLLEAGRMQTVSDNLAAIDAMVERMARIVTQLKTFAHKGSATLGTVDLAAVVRNMLVLVEHRLRDTRTQLLIDMPPRLLVRGDATRLEQVLVNLVANAVDAMEANATREVRIDARRRDGRVVVAVVDNGPGLDDAAMERLLEPFFTTKPPGQGLGLGLVISSKIVQDFGGTLRPSRAEPGMRFEFDLAPAEDGDA